MRPDPKEDIFCVALKCDQYLLAYGLLNIHRRIMPGHYSDCIEAPHATFFPSASIRDRPMGMDIAMKGTIGAFFAPEAPWENMR